MEMEMEAPETKCVRSEAEDMDIPYFVGLSLCHSSYTSSSISASAILNVLHATELGVLQTCSH